MAQQMLKRQIDESSSNNDLNDDEFDVTWGGKRSRYIYNYAIPFPDTPDQNSDQTESVYSYQTKSTAQIVTESDLSSSEYCQSGSHCQYLNNGEFEVLSSSSSSFHNEKYSSDSSTTLNIEIPKTITIHDKTLYDSDNGYIPDDTDVQITNTNIDLPPPACFKKCVKCQKENENPYFQYCYICFRHRMEFIVDKPKPKSFKRLRMFSQIKEDNLFKDSQTSDVSNLKLSSSSDISNLYPSQEGLDYSNNVENLCNICLKMPKNGIFNHGKIGHIYCCYPCAKKYKQKSNRCPICKVKIRFITKMIVV